MCSYILYRLIAILVVKNELIRSTDSMPGVCIMALGFCYKVLRVNDTKISKH